MSDCPAFRLRSIVGVTDLFDQLDAAETVERFDEFLLTVGFVGEHHERR